MRHVTILAFGCAAMLLAAAARADTHDAELEQARQHAAAAKVHYDLGEFEKAAEEYILVYRIRPLPALLFNIAQSYRQAGQYEKAKQFYQSYLRENPDPKTTASVKNALREIEELQAKERQAKNGPPQGVKQPPDASLPMKSGAGVAGAAAASAAAGGASAAQPSSSASFAKPQSTASTTSSAAKTDTVVASAKTPAAVPAASRPSAPITGFSTAPMPQEKSHTLRWVGVGATATAFALGGAFGLKTLSSRSPDDAKKANLMYGIGAGLAVITGAIFLFDF